MARQRVNRQTRAANLDEFVSPAPTRSNCSPIWIAARRRLARVRLGLGDALLYRGTHVEHWRRRHPPGRTTAMASLHYGRPPTAR